MDASLTDGQMSIFERKGYLRLPEAFAPEAAIQLQERMWTELREDFGIDRCDRRTWWQPMQSLHRAKRDPLQSAVTSDRLISAIRALLGPVRWRVPSNWGVVLVTFPNPGSGDWSLPTAGWHFDFELHRNAISLGGLFMFTFFSVVEARGGGTLIVEGSHRSDDPYNLDRFVQAQEADYEHVLSEIRGGKKRTHWIRTMKSSD